MAKNSVSDWDTTASNNTDIAGINILGTGFVSGFDGAIRTVMSQVAAYTRPLQQTASTRTALKALDTSKYSLVYLTELGFERKYIWRVGDYSAEVAADPVGEKYLKADSVASSVGAWVWEYVDRKDWHPLTGSPTIVRDSESGHSWAIGGFEDLSEGRTNFLHARGAKHGITNGGGLYRYVSRDSGLTLKQEQSLLVDVLRDSRYASCGVIGATAHVFIKQTTEASALTHVALTSSDYFHSNVTETAVTTSFGHHPHGKVMTFPASLGGSDTQGAIVYTYGGNNIRSIRTTNNWATVTENSSMILPPAGVTSLAEPYVVECGAPNKRWMVIRVESPAGANFYGSYSTNGTTWTAAYDLGIYGGKTPTYARYEERTNRVYLYRVNRINPSEFDANFPASALLWTWEDADRLMAGGTVRRDWSVACILPDFVTGYLTEITVGDSVFVFGTCAESNLEGSTHDWTTERRSRTKHFMLGQTPLTSGLRQSVNKNELRNPQFRVWQNGTSFDASLLTLSPTPTANGIMTADEVFVAVNAGVTGTVSRTDLPAVYERAIPGGPNYGLRINLSAGDDPTDEQFIMVRRRDVSRWADSVATWTLWIRGTPPSTLKFRARVSYDGTAYDETSSSSVTLTPLRTTEDITVLSASVEIPSVVGDTITSNGLVTFELRTTNEATDYEICSWKLEEGAERTELLPMPYNESLVLCRQELRVFGGAGFSTIVSSGSALLTTSWEGVLEYGPMASQPTVVAEGSASDYEIRSSANITLDSLPTFSVIQQESCIVTAAVTGATQNRPYRLRNTSGGGAGKIIVKTGF